MSNSSEILSVKTFFKEQGITVSSEWLQACISFVKEEHGRNLSPQHLKNFVYQQWLNADLEEIGTCTFGSLCRNLLSAQKITLTGKFALQVEGIRDVGRPAYSQLKELENTLNSNAEFSAAPPATQAPWEAKPTRMLMLKLTDGCSFVQGMEYRPINNLSPNLPPGLKVLIQGPVDCRFGVMLLTPEKIKVLGGEVEDKLEQYSRKSILRGALGIPPEENREASETTRSEVPSSAPLTQDDNTLSQVSQSNRVYPTPQNQTSSSNRQQSNGSSRVQSNSFTSNGGIHQNSGSSTRQPTSFMPRNNPPGLGQNQNQLDSLDDFENEDDDFDLNVDPGVLDEIERESISKSQSYETSGEDHDLWFEDDEVMQEAMAFQDENPGFEMPNTCAIEEQQRTIDNDKPFVYLTSVLSQPSPDCTVTIKAFIITVLSKLECTIDKGWNLTVKINDGSATLDVNIHDKVLEEIIGISAPTMVIMQTEAAENPEKRRKVMEAISKCKVTLQNFNCIMDIKFSAGSKPCLIKYRPISQLDAEQLLQRVRSSS